MRRWTEFVAAWAVIVLALLLAGLLLRSCRNADGPRRPSTKDTSDVLIHAWAAHFNLSQSNWTVVVYKRTNQVENP